METRPPPHVNFSLWIFCHNVRLLPHRRKERRECFQNDWFESKGNGVFSNCLKALVSPVARCENKFKSIGNYMGLEKLCNPRELFLWYIHLSILVRFLLLKSFGDSINNKSISICFLNWGMFAYSDKYTNNIFVVSINFSILTLRYIHLFKLYCYFFCTFQKLSQTINSSNSS